MRSSQALVVCLFVLFACGASCLDAYDWYLQSPRNATAAAPLQRYHHGAAAVGNDTSFIVVVGGFDFIGPGVFLNDTWAFDTRNNTWHFINSSLWTNLTNRAYFSANTYRHEVVVFGGEGPNSRQYNDVWRFSNFTWKKDEYVNTTEYFQGTLYREYHAAAVSGNKLYVFGGHALRFGRTTNELFAYDLVYNNWTLLIEDSQGRLPLGRQGHSLHPYEDPLYGPSLILFGGYSDNPYTGGFNDAWQYVIRENKWYGLNDINAPAGRAGHIAALVGNTLYIQGGFSVHNIDKPPTFDVYFGDTWSLTLSGGGVSKWSQLTVDSAFGIGRRQGHEAAVVNGTIYSIGGYVQYVGLTNEIWAWVNAPVV